MCVSKEVTLALPLVAAQSVNVMGPEKRRPAAR